MYTNPIVHENRNYWSARAASYAAVNQGELADDHRSSWRHTIASQISAHFPEKAPEDIRILEVGTGPGFFAIILAEAGYCVTAIDLTPNMLEEAKKNAGPLAGKIHFQEMNAEALAFSDGIFDVIVTRNLTWNLPHPDLGYQEWQRVLKPNGILLNFDANWYNYLFYEEDRERYQQDRNATAQKGYNDQNVGENFDVMEDIAKRIPLSSIRRPGWDRQLLTRLGMQVTIDENIWQQVWSEAEKCSFASTPMFMIKNHQAVKNPRKKRCRTVFFRGFILSM